MNFLSQKRSTFANKNTQKFFSFFYVLKKAKNGIDILKANFVLTMHILGAR